MNNLRSRPQVRDGNGPFSPLIGRYCGTTAPSALRSSSNFLWVKFLSDATTERAGFVATLTNVDPVCGSHQVLNVSTSVQVRSVVHCPASGGFPGFVKYFLIVPQLLCSFPATQASKGNSQKIVNKTCETT